MSINEELEKRLFDIAFGQANDCSDWMHHKSMEKENYLSGPELEVDPKDAKTLDEVKSFKIFVDLTAMEVTTFERQE